MAHIMDGAKLAEHIKAGVQLKVQELKEQGIEVGLAMLMAGDDSASKQYFLSTVRSCEKVGIRPVQHMLSGSISMNELLNIVHEINRDERVSGLLILLPLPARIDTRKIVNEVIPEKDVDGLGYLSIGRLAADESTFQIFKEGKYESLYGSLWSPSVSSFLPCTPFGVIRLLEHHGIEIRGKHAVVIGKSLAVGKPLAHMLLAKEATVTVCHRETVDLASHTMRADILCSATGVRGLIKEDMIKDGAVVVDIGINVSPEGTIAGDIDFPSVSKKASYITPVPGGVGPVTIAMLLENTVRSSRNSAFKLST